MKPRHLAVVVATAVVAAVVGLLSSSIGFAMIPVGVTALGFGIAVTIGALHVRLVERMRAQNPYAVIVSSRVRAQNPYAVIVSSRVRAQLADRFAIIVNPIPRSRRRPWPWRWRGALTAVVSDAGIDWWFGLVGPRLLVRTGWDSVVDVRRGSVPMDSSRRDVLVVAIDVERMLVALGLPVRRDDRFALDADIVEGDELDRVVARVRGHLPKTRARASIGLSALTFRGRAVTDAVGSRVDRDSKPQPTDPQESPPVWGSAHGEASAASDESTAVLAAVARVAARSASAPRHTSAPRPMTGESRLDVAKLIVFTVLFAGTVLWCVAQVIIEGLATVWK